MLFQNAGNVVFVVIIANLATFAGSISAGWVKLAMEGGTQ
jgi:hypothetical protein